MLTPTLFLFAMLRDNIFIRCKNFVFASISLRACSLPLFGLYYIAMAGGVGARFATAVEDAATIKEVNAPDFYWQSIADYPGRFAENLCVS